MPCAAGIDAQSKQRTFSPRAALQELCSPDQTPESLQTEGGLASRLLWFKVGEKTCTQTCCRRIFKGESDVQIPKR